MRGDYIDFIAEYCDRWCERCPFTARCSAYAVKIAMAMCDGDVSAGIELAVGAPPPRDAAEERAREEFLEWLSELNVEPTQEELTQLHREEEARDDRIDESPLMTQSEVVSVLAHRWLDEHDSWIASNTDTTLADALEIAGRDAFFIHVKLHRALDGRDRATNGEDFDNHPMQNDWNGSAKIALISIVRSTKAWEIIAGKTNDPDARHISAELSNLRHEVERAFPNVWRFIRPGFDQ